MADAKKCDRCGAYYDKHGDKDHANTLYVENDNFDGKVPCDKKYDICPSCMAFIQEWLKNSSVKSCVDCELYKDGYCTDPSLNEPMYLDGADFIAEGCTCFTRGAKTETEKEA